MKSFFCKNKKIFPPYIYIFVLFIVSILIIGIYVAVAIIQDPFCDYKFILGILGFVDAWVIAFYKWGNGHAKKDNPVLESESD